MKDCGLILVQIPKQRRPRLPGGQVHIPTCMEGATTGGSTEADTPWLPWAQAHIPTCMEGVTTRGRQHGRRTLPGALGSGEGSGHRQEALPLLQPPTQHSAALTLTGGEEQPSPDLLAGSLLS